MITSAIVGCGAYLPSKVLTNHDMCKILDTSDEWIVGRTGIKQRHIAEGETTTDMATKALLNAIHQQDIESIDAIIVATTTPDNIFPATAVEVQKNIKLKKCFAFDIQAVCSGFLYGLSVAHGLIISKQANKVALIGAEKMSKLIDWTNRNTSILFGDGAGAVILERSNNHGIIGIELLSDAQLNNILKAGHSTIEHENNKIIMNGKEVFRHAIDNMVELTQNLLNKYSLTTQDIDWFIPHQANSRIIKAVAEKLLIEESKTIYTIQNHANTSAASIPLALNELIKNKEIKRKQIICTASAGGGMTFGSALIRY